MKDRKHWSGARNAQDRPPRWNGKLHPTAVGRHLHVEAHRSQLSRAYTGMPRAFDGEDTLACTVCRYILCSDSCPIKVNERKTAEAMRQNQAAADSRRAMDRAVRRTGRELFDALPLRESDVRPVQPLGHYTAAEAKQKMAEGYTMRHATIAAGQDPGARWCMAAGRVMYLSGDGSWKPSSNSWASTNLLHLFKIDVHAQHRCLSETELPCEF